MSAATVGNTITRIILIAMLVLIGAGEAWTAYRLITGDGAALELVLGLLVGAAFLATGAWMLWRMPGVATGAATSAHRLSDDPAPGAYRTALRRVRERLDARATGGPPFAQLVLLDADFNAALKTVWRVQSSWFESTGYIAPWWHAFTEGLREGVRTALALDQHAAAAVDDQDGRLRAALAAALERSDAQVRGELNRALLEHASRGLSRADDDLRHNVIAALEADLTDSLTVFHALDVFAAGLP